MELNVQSSEPQISKQHTSRRRGFVASLQQVDLKVKSVRDRLGDACLGAQIPDWIRRHLTFYRLHCTYFLLITSLGSSILYIAHRSSAGENRFSMVDSIFNTVSIVTVTGITSVRIAEFSVFDRIVLLILMTLGSPVFTSLLPLYVRRFYFFRNHRMHVKDCMMEMRSCLHYVEQCQQMETRSTLNFPTENPDEEDRIAREIPDANPAGGASLPDKVLVFSSPGHSMADHDSGSQYGPHGKVQAMTSSLNTKSSLTMDIVTTFSKPKSKTDLLDFGNSEESQVPERRRETSSDADNYALNGQSRPGWLRAPPDTSSFNIMTSMEYRGLVALSWLVPIYLIGTQLASFTLSLLLFYARADAANLLKERNLNTVFFSISTTIAAFTNSGVPAHDDNLVPFRSQCFLLLLYTLVSLMGNLLYPPCIRLAIWILRGFSTKSRKPVYSYLLNHPRRCFTHLFPHKQSVWLCLTVVGFTGFQLIFFCTLDWHSDALAGLDPVSKVVDGIYQSVSVRNAGGAVVAISELAASMLVLYLFMMFIAAYPVVLLRQNTTDSEYEHAELGIYDKRWEEELTDNSLAFQSRKLLAKDSVYLCIILFLICLIESKQIEEDPLNYSIFNIIFEVVSAYGGVGMSIGYSCNLRLARGDQQVESEPCTDVPYSFSGKWSPTGRIILAIAMFMGRHRGLPDDIDSAIKLPCFQNIPLSASGVGPDDGPAERPSASLAPDISESKPSIHQTLLDGQQTPHESQQTLEKRSAGNN